MVGKEKEIESLIKKQVRIVEKIKEKLKKEIKKVEFKLTFDKIEIFYKLVEKDIEDYFEKCQNQYELEMGNEKISLEIKAENKNTFFINLLKEIFKEERIFVKLGRKSSFEKFFVVFKDNESILMAFLMEKFQNNRLPKGQFEIYISKQKLEELIKIYEVENYSGESFIEKLKEIGILFESKINRDNLNISFKDSIYTDENEKSIREATLQEYNLKMNEKLKNELEKTKEKLNILKKSTNFLEKNMNNFKVEQITILSIFVCIFAYLSVNFKMAVELFSAEKVVKNINLLTGIFGTGLIPIIVIFFLVKYLFLIPNEYLFTDCNSEKLSFLKKYIPGVAIIGIIIFISVILASIYKSFQKDYENNNSNLIKLQQEITSKSEEIEFLKKEISNLKMKYKEQAKINLNQNLNKDNHKKEIKIVIDNKKSTEK